MGEDEGGVDIVNAIAVCVDVFRSVADSDMSVEVVLGANTHDAGVVSKTDSCDGGGCSMGWRCPNEVTRGRTVGKNIDGDVAYYSMDFV